LDTSLFICLFVCLFWCTLAFRLWYCYILVHVVCPCNQFSWLQQLTSLLLLPHMSQLWGTTNSVITEKVAASHGARITDNWIVTLVLYQLIQQWWYRYKYTELQTLDVKVQSHYSVWRQRMQSDADSML